MSKPTLALLRRDFVSRPTAYDVGRASWQGELVWLHSPLSCHEIATLPMIVRLIRSTVDPIELNGVPWPDEPSFNPDVDFLTDRSAVR